MFRDVLNRSYFIMFSINATILVVAILYSIFYLKVGIFVQFFGSTFLAFLSIKIHILKTDANVAGAKAHQ